MHSPGLNQSKKEAARASFTKKAVKFKEQSVPINSDFFLPVNTAAVRYSQISHLDKSSLEHKILDVNKSPEDKKYSELRFEAMSLEKAIVSEKDFISHIVNTNKVNICYS